MIFQLREKLEMSKESRGLVRKLATVHGLGEGNDNSEDSTSEWVKRMREKEKEKKLAEQRVRM